MSDLKIAYKALVNKEKEYSLLWDYYDGKHRIFHLSKKLQKQFASTNIFFSENWCAAIVDAMLDRIILLRFSIPGNPKAEEYLNYLWSETEMSLDDDESHLCALVTGEAFLMAWKSDEEIEAYFQDSRLCYVHYDKASPRKVKFAAKWWVDGKKRYLNLFYPERIVYYESSKDSSMILSEKAFYKIEEKKNPLGKVPIIHLRRSSRKPHSELRNAIDPQNAINKLLSDMMVVSEYSAFPQRYAITEADLSGLRSGPDQLWEIPAGDGESERTQVGQFSAANIQQYLAALERAAKAIATITRTPKHYFMLQGGAPSGEALITMEAPLNAKCNRFIERAKKTYAKFGQFLLSLADIEIDANQIQVIYQDPKTIQPLTRSIIRQNNVNAGIPITTQLRIEGWTDKQIERMVSEKQAEQVAAHDSLATALLEQQKAFDQQ